MKNFSFRSPTNGIYGLYYISRWNLSQTLTSNSKYNPNLDNISYKAIQAKHRPLTPSIIETVAFFTHPYAFILTPNIPYISIDQKSHMKMKSMLKIKNFSNRSQTNDIYHL